MPAKPSIRQQRRTGQGCGDMVNQLSHFRLEHLFILPCMFPYSKRKKTLLRVRHSMSCVPTILLRQPRKAKSIESFRFDMILGRVVDWVCCRNYPPPLREIRPIGKSARLLRLPHHSCCENALAYRLHSTSNVKTGEGSTCCDGMKSLALLQWTV
jgi:hypothetical protein